MAGVEEKKSNAIRKCVALLLGPVARFCVRNAFKIKEFTETLKRALIDAAVAELRRTDQPISVSKIHVMTGVPRLEVNRIYVKGQEKNVETNVLTKVIGRWQQDKRFRTKAGKPRVLSLDGMESDFVKLVTSVSVALNPYTILFELERTGHIERTPRGVKLRSRTYMTTDLTEGYRFMAEDVDDLMESVRENVEQVDDIPNHHIKTEFNNIPERYHEEIREWMDREGAAFHQKARNFLAQYDRDMNPARRKTGGGTVRVLVGSFSRAHRLENEDEQ